MPANVSLTNLSTKPPEYFSQPRLEMLRFIPKTARRILDVGCGEGHFGRLLKEKIGAEVWGIELVPAAAEIAQQNLDQVFCGDVVQQLQTIPDHQFDCITFNDVLEHLVDPYQVLLAVKKLLSPKGVVVCSLPNVRYFRNLFNLVIRGEWRYTEEGILDKTHLRFFTKKSIIEMFQSLDYRIVILEGINRTPSWKVALLNLMTLGFLSDTRYLRFCCLAEPRTIGRSS